MKNDATDLALDALIWVTAPAVGVAWLTLTFQLWRALPPLIIILLATALLVLISQLLKTTMPTDSPVGVMAYRLFISGVGLCLALWRVVS